mmetsp:Transcript_10065/g.61156  ORF Transcript_10065/g.61156 Transcript_10065/m.61156 type:complete len:239 (+) Transcript_10065:1642-2358(+)
MGMCLGSMLVDFSLHRWSTNFVHRFPCSISLLEPIFMHTAYFKCSAPPLGKMVLDVQPLKCTALVGFFGRVIPLVAILRTNFGLFRCPLLFLFVVSTSLAIFPIAAPSLFSFFLLGVCICELAFLLLFPLEFFQFFCIEEPSPWSTHPPGSMFVPGFVQVRFPGLDEFVLLLGFRSGLPPAQDAMVLLGIDVHWFFFDHFGGKRHASMGDVGEHVVWLHHGLLVVRHHGTIVGIIYTS